MTPEFSIALDSREAAAAVLMQAAHDLTAALVKFNAASDSVLQEIPRLAKKVGEQVKAKHSAQWSDPPTTEVEAAQRKHQAIGAGHGAAGNLEQALCQAFGNGLARGSAAETLGLEFSTAAGVFLRAAADVAAQRAPLTQPDGQFLKIISVQCNRLRELTEELSR
ncbi:MAG: hypothetical protein ACLP0B_09855 [Steroidobacteraceae bacterium]|jgi:hypothetical protein